MSVESMSIDTQIIMLEQLKGPEAKKQIKKLQTLKKEVVAKEKHTTYVASMRKQFGNLYDEETDWWPNKYPDF